jgi:hypothetical protein
MARVLYGKRGFSRQCSSTIGDEGSSETLVSPLAAGPGTKNWTLTPKGSGTGCRAADVDGVDNFGQGRTGKQKVRFWLK